MLVAIAAVFLVIAASGWGRKLSYRKRAGGEGKNAEIHLPFGGVKNTGTGGREAGSVAIEEFTELKSVFIDYSDMLQKAQIDTEHRLKEKLHSK